MKVKYPKAANLLVRERVFVDDSTSDATSDLTSDATFDATSDTTTDATLDLVDFSSTIT
jgi:hypothetical protein